MGLRRHTKPGLAPGFFLLAVLAGCGNGGEPAAAEPAAGAITVRLDIPGVIEDGDIQEASGLAYSVRRPGLLWVHNDRGDKARIYAMSDTGESLGRVRLRKADNEDWEDMAAFELDGTAYLLVADIGDNDAVRNDTMLYVVAEPNLEADDRPELKASWTIPFSYEDGARDAEAVAVDVAGRRALLLTKRDLPPRLYEVPIVPPADARVTARFVGALRTLPQPSARDVGFAPKTGNWHWQPTAMDIAPDGSALAVLTYGAIYYYFRDADEDWTTAVSRPPLRLGIEDIRNAEALAFSPDGRSIFVTVEKKHAPIVRIDLEGAP